MRVSSTTTRDVEGVAVVAVVTVVAAVVVVVVVMVVVIVGIGMAVVVVVVVVVEVVSFAVVHSGCIRVSTWSAGLRRALHGQSSMGEEQYLLDIILL